MKKVLLLFLLLMLASTPYVFAESTNYNEIDDWVQIPDIEPFLGVENAWYYSPSHTKINQQGRLETLIKRIVISSESPDNVIGSYDINIVYANQTLDKRMTTKRLDYKNDGTLADISYSSKWRPVIPGESFDKALQAAYQYTSDNK